MDPAGGRSVDDMPRQQVLGRRCQVERKRERRALGSLQSLVVASATRDRYFTAVSRFLAFLKSHGYGYPTASFEVYRKSLA